MTREDITSEAAEGDRDRRFHGGTPAHLDDDELAQRTETERAEAGLTDYDPADVPPATDDPVPFDPAADTDEQDIRSVTARQEAEGETRPLTEDNPFPPTRYAE
jgi:predicted component of type VI protein secretion system